MFRLSDGEDTIPEFDGRMDGQTDIPSLAIPVLCIACYANALVKTRVNV